MPANSTCGVTYENALRFTPLVKATARRICHRMPRNVELQDLVQDGITGLLDGAQKFDEGQGILFSTYIKHRIRGAIYDGLRMDDWATRDMRRFSKKLKKSAVTLGNLLQ